LRTGTGDLSDKEISDFLVFAVGAPETMHIFEEKRMALIHRNA